MVYPRRFFKSVFIFLLLVGIVPFSAALNDSGIEKQLGVIQKLQEANNDLAESTLSNVSFLIAFLGGILSFLAPCTVALFPAFLAFTAKSGRNVTLSTLAFFSGFSLAFVALGIALTALGRVSFATFQQDVSLLVRASGIILILLGAMMFFGRGFSFILLRGRLPRDTLGTVAFGALFAIGWSACIGPIIAGIFVMAAVFHNYVYTAFLLFFYALGLAVPLFAAAFAYDRFNLAESRLVNGLALTVKIGRSEVVFTSTNVISGLLMIFLGAFFILNRGTTAITAADLLGIVALIAVIAAATLAMHKHLISKFINNPNARKLAAVAEILAAIAAFSFITSRYDVRTSGITERLSDAVLGNIGAFSMVAVLILAIFAAALFYFARKQMKSSKAKI